MGFVQTKSLLRKGVRPAPVLFSESLLQKKFSESLLHEPPSSDLLTTGGGTEDRRFSWYKVVTPRVQRTFCQGLSLGDTRGRLVGWLVGRLQTALILCGVQAQWRRINAKLVGRAGERVPRWAPLALSTLRISCGARVKTCSLTQISQPTTIPFILMGRHLDLASFKPLDEM